MCNPPLVSIIVPVYNLEKYIGECVDTLLCQTYKNLEIIAVIDGSTDSSAAICRERRKKDQRVIVIEQANGGVSAARNTGIQAASGDYIMFVDGDDWVEPDMVETMQEAIAANRTDACFCNCYYRNAEKICSATTEEGAVMDASMLLQRHLHYGFIASPGLGLIDRKAVQKCCFDTTIHALEDWEFNFRVLTRIKCATVISAPFYHYRAIDGSASRSPLNEKKMTCFRIEDRVKDYIQQNDIPYKEEAKYVPVFLLNHMLVILANTPYAAREAGILCSKARSLLRYSFTGKGIPVRQRVYIWMAAVSPRLFCFVYRVKNRRIAD